MKLLQVFKEFDVVPTGGTQLLRVQSFTIIPGQVPQTYGQISDDLTLSYTNLERIAFTGMMYQQIMEEQYVVFQIEQNFKNKVLFFLTELNFEGKCYWSKVLEWNDAATARSITYCHIDSSSVHEFIEKWESNDDRRRLLEESVFFVLTSIEEINDNEDEDEDDWAAREAHSIQMSSLRSS